MNCIIIQARVTSSRMPNKIFYNIDKKPALYHVIDECMASNADHIILAIPKSQNEDFLKVKKYYGENSKLSIQLGSEDNVLERYYISARNHNAKNIIRITSDCFLIAKEHINTSLAFFNKNTYDYINNSTVTRVLSDDNPDDYETDTETPDGFNVEIFSFSSLKEAYKNAITKYDIEHVTPWIKRNKKCEVFNTGAVKLKGKFSVDTFDDFEIVKALYILKKHNRLQYE